MIDVTLMGCGRWGSRVLQSLVRHPGYRVVAVVDPDARARARARAIAGNVKHRLDGGAVFITTPSKLHAAHAHQALDAGMDVFVEKPLAMNSADAVKLCAHVAASDRVGMVGHVLRFHPLVCDLVQRVKRGDIGTPTKLSARRFTCSGSPDPLWTLGPHDLVTLRAMDDSVVDEVALEGSNGSVAMALRFASGLHATIEVSTNATRAERVTVVKGSDGVARIDELADDSEADPLSRQLDHFAQCVAERRQPITSFEHARWVVDTLARADAALA